jgi:hypothetical protein
MRSVPAAILAFLALAASRTRLRSTGPSLYRATARSCTCSFRYFNQELEDHFVVAYGDVIA